MGDGHRRASRCSTRSRPPTTRSTRSAAAGSAARPSDWPDSSTFDRGRQRPPGRGQRPVGRRLGQVHQEHDQPGRPGGPWGPGPAARSSPPTSIDRPDGSRPSSGLETGRGLARGGVPRPSRQSRLPSDRRVAPGLRGRPGDDRRETTDPCEPPEPRRDSPTRPADADRARPGRLWALALVAAILAGLGSWLAGEATRTLLRPARARIVIDDGRQDEHPRPSRSRSRPDRKNATLAYGGPRRPPRPGAGAGRRPGPGLGPGGAGGRPWPGLVVGLAAGVGRSGRSCRSTTASSTRAGGTLARPVLPFLMSTPGIWAAVGLAGGSRSAWAGGRGRIASAALGGLVGGAPGGGALRGHRRPGLPDRRDHRSRSRPSGPPG